MEDLMKAEDFFKNVLEDASEPTVVAVLCMLLDLCEARFNMTYDELMELVEEQRQQVNEKMGPYPLEE